jgi:hypothetical protein
MTESQRKSIHRVIQQKVKAVKEMEEAKWAELKKQFRSVAADNEQLRERIESAFIESRSSLIYGCINGVILVRYTNHYVKDTIHVSIFEDRVERVLKNIPIPYANGKVANLGGIISIGVVGGTQRIIGKFIFDDEIVASNLHISSFAYDDAEEVMDFQDAVEDFRIALRGIAGVTDNQSDPIKKFASLRDDFCTLLSEATREEEVQVFLKENPVLLDNVTQCFPKLKLGSEMTTDFVLQKRTSRGFEYAFVEIERANLPIFVGTGDYDAKFNHAWKQLEDWDRWIDKHLSYLEQEKLPQLSRPYRLVLIAGRTAALTDRHKDDLRSRCRNSTIEFYTYDDILVRFDEFIDALRRFNDSY